MLRLFERGSELRLGVVPEAEQRDPELTRSTRAARTRRRRLFRGTTETGDHGRRSQRAAHHQLATRQLNH
jgi:hypothetical protein